MEQLDIGTTTIGSADPRMRSVFARVRRLAPTRLPILVRGESGVGKELVARSLHANAPWRAGPFVPINCGALPAGLVDSELFGHERGSFSGAAETKMGLFEAAVGGTLFLDEIGELQLDLQARLLRFLDDYLVRRVGGLSARPVEIRVVSATNRDLQAFVDEGRFRDDLRHRLCGGVLELPPLRDRRVDLLAIARGFLDDARARSGDAPVALSDSAALALLRYRWPGNIRELKHAMEYVAATVDGPDVGVEHLPAAIGAAAGGAAILEAPRATARSPFVPIKEQIDRLVRNNMREALQAASGNVARASRLLRMSRRTFTKKMKEFGLRSQLLV